MKTSTERILTTHLGSMPRSKAVINGDFAKENEQEFDPARLAETIAAAVTEVVRLQVEADVDVVSDGEMRKISYATYIKGTNVRNHSHVLGDLSAFTGGYVHLPYGRKYIAT